MAETLELIVEIAVTEDGSAQAMIFPDPDGYTASSLLLETGKSGQMIWVHRIKVTVPLPYVTEAAVAVAPHASGVLGVEPFEGRGRGMAGRQNNPHTAEGGYIIQKAEG